MKKSLILIIALSISSLIVLTGCGGASTGTGVNKNKIAEKTLKWTDYKNPFYQDIEGASSVLVYTLKMGDELSYPFSTDEQKEAIIEKAFAFDKAMILDRADIGSNEELSPKVLSAASYSFDRKKQINEILRSTNLEKPPAEQAEQIEQEIVKSWIAKKEQELADKAKKSKVEAEVKLRAEKASSILDKLRAGNITGAIKAIKAGANVNEKRSDELSILDILLLRPEKKHEPVVVALLEKNAKSIMGRSMLSKKVNGLEVYEGLGKIVEMGVSRGEAWTYQNRVGLLNIITSDIRSRNNSFSINTNWENLNYQTTYKLNSTYSNKGREVFFKEWLTLILINYKIQFGIEDTMLSGITLYGMADSVSLFWKLINPDDFQNRMGKLSEMLVAIDLYLKDVPILDIAAQYGVKKEAKQLHNAIYIMLKQAK